jgi:hypothetical protein
LNVAKVGKVFIVTCIPVLTVVGAALGCEIVMEKEPEAVRATGFFS